MILTAVASVYAAVAGAVLANGGFRGGQLSRFSIVVIVACWTFGILSMIRARQKAGVAVLSFPRWFRWRAHGAVMVASVGLTLTSLSDSDSQPPAFFLLFPLLYHTMIEASATVSFTESGVYTGKLRRWEDWKFELRPSTSELVGYPDPNPHRTAPLVVRVPADRLKEVGEFLTERQTSIEEPA